MQELLIRHRTSYRYQVPVQLGPHRLMLRPRESCEVRLKTFDLNIRPQAQVSWAHDVFGNAVATAVFAGLTEELVIASSARVQLEAVAWPVFDIRSEEHTSELQSLMRISYAVFCLKKKTRENITLH